MKTTTRQLTLSYTPTTETDDTEVFFEGLLAGLRGLDGLSVVEAAAVVVVPVVKGAKYRGTGRFLTTREDYEAALVGTLAWPWDDRREFVWQKTGANEWVFSNKLDDPFTDERMVSGRNAGVKRQVVEVVQ